MAFVVGFFAMGCSAGATGARTSAVPADDATPAASTEESPAAAKTIGAGGVDAIRGAQLIAPVKDASNLQLVDGRAFFEHGNALWEAFFDGRDPKELASADAIDPATFFAAPNEAYAFFADKTCYRGKLFDRNVGSLHIAIDSLGCLAPPQNSLYAPLQAAVGRLHVLGADAYGYYIATMTQAGMCVERWARGTLARTTLIARGASARGVQMARSYFTWIENEGDVLRQNLSDVGSQPILVAQINDCRISVGADYSFCTTPDAIYQLPARAEDVVQKLVDAVQSNTGPLGNTLPSDGIMWVTDQVSAKVNDILQNVVGDAGQTPLTPVTDAVQHTLTEITLPTLPTAAVCDCATKVIATTSGAITSVAADATHVIYAAQGTGIFALPR